MNQLNFRKYLIRFENEVVLRGVEQGYIGQHELVTCRSCRSDKSKFAREIGSTLPYQIPLVVDYYGYYKKSKGFYTLVEEKQMQMRESHRQLKMIETMVVHFASLKIEDITLLTNSSYLSSRFAEFKMQILEKRGFRGKSSSSS